MVILKKLELECLVLLLKNPNLEFKSTYKDIDIMTHTKEKHYIRHFFSLLKKITIMTLE